MSLDNISYCRYLADIRQPWRQEHYKVAKIVRAIKGEPFNGYADFKIGEVWQRLDPDHGQVATDWFVDRVATETKFSGSGHLLCPIPDSQSTPSSTHAPRTLALARRLSERLPQLKIWDHLRFKKPMPRKVRDEEMLFENFVCTATVPSGYIILLDDVCTSGAHARAAQRRLRGQNTSNMCAMSVARTMLDPNEAVFGFRLDHL
jgi:hypothetical protein